MSHELSCFEELEKRSHPSASALVSGLQHARTDEASGSSIHEPLKPLVGGASFARTAPFIDGVIYLYECHAAAPGAVSTSVDSCTITSSRGTSSAPPSTSPGPAALTDSGIVWDPSPNQVCWTVSARFADGTSQAKSGCTTTSDIAGAGAT